MEQPPPLTPQEISQMTDVQNAQLGQPQTVKVFGILHLLFAAFGILTAISGIYVAVAGNPFLRLLPRTPAMQAQAQAQNALQQQMMPVTIISTVVTLVIAGLMLYAGIVLLKKRKGALKWSNRYAWTSLFGKAVNLVLMFFFTLPLTKQMTAQMSGTTALPGAFESMMLVGMVMGVLISCIYPILTLVLLNRPATKTWFANQPA